jgi:hypothetical protein
MLIKVATDNIGSSFFCFVEDAFMAERKSFAVFFSGKFN